MTQSSPEPTQQFRGKLTRRTLLLLLPLTIIPIALIGVINLINSTNFLREQIIIQFNNVAQTQVEQINVQVENSHELLEALGEDALLNESLDRALSIDPESADWADARAEVLLDYKRVSNAQTKYVFENIAIVTPDREIIISYNPLIEGEELEQGTFAKLLSVPTSLLYYDTYLFTDQLTDRLLLLSSYQVMDGLGNHKATLIGISGSEAFKRILEIGKLSHPQARPYYISDSDLGGVFVGLSPTTGEITAFSPSLDHIETVMPKIRGKEMASVVEFESFNNVPVLGFVNWVDSINAAIVLEVPQSAILEPIQGAITTQIAFLGIMLVILGLIIWQGTRRIVRPIEAISKTAREFADGDLQVRAAVNRTDEIGLLAYSFNYVADELVALYRSMETTVDARTQQIQTTSEVAQIVTAATSLEEMLARVASLITERFNYSQTSIYLMDRGGDNLVMKETAGQVTQRYFGKGLQIAVGSRSIVGNVAASNTPWVADDVKQDPYYLELDALPGTQSEAAIPLSIGGRVLGVLDAQSDELKAFDEQDIAILQTLGRQIAAAIQNARLLENTQDDLQSANLLYQTSHKLASAETINEIIQNLDEILQQIPHIVQVFAMESGKLHAIAPLSGAAADPNLVSGIPVSQDERIRILTEWAGRTINTSRPPADFSQELLIQARHIDCREFVLIPLISREKLLGLILLGTATENTLASVDMTLYNSIAEMANTALAKIEGSNRIAASLAELQSFSALSQAISTETNLENLFSTLHQQVIQTVGDLNFLIALYDSATELIEIPYMLEDNQIISIPTFPLGQGLTSIVIRTRQPLMIVEDTVNRSRALGAIVTSGKAAKSWLGVPLIAAGEVVGAMAVQDLENEHRFDEDDLRLLITLAGQVAPTIRNARLLAVTQEAAERDRQLYEITNSIRRATSIPEILKITTQELSQALDLKKAKIEISTEAADQKAREQDTEEKSK